MPHALKSVNYLTLKAKTEVTNADEELLNLLVHHKRISSESKENSEKWQKASDQLPDFAKDTGWPKFPFHIDYFYPEDGNWKNILARHLGCRGGSISMPALLDFNESLIRWSQKISEENKKEIQKLMPCYDFDKEEENRKRFEIMASFNDKRIEWLKKERRRISREKSKVGLPSIEREGDRISDALIELERLIMDRAPLTIEGFKAKADWILQDAIRMEPDKASWEFRQIEILVSGINKFYGAR